MERPINSLKIELLAGPRYFNGEQARQDILQQIEMEHSNDRFPTSTTAVIG
ncbi:hypothetical protein [Ectothiorhodospira sp. BSL-9]|uniref:hypothetical protein n=1 Tax=Ectothiorhodospira sp. BSL-9 TaxID=1442136 RepID=UPI0012E78618|nr:hypothetical protein [Ectothiorhodospira sp. BSL-9]